MTPKPKAPVWLREAFAEGVIELEPERPAPAYRGALGRCWLAQHDPMRRPCEGRLERFHFIPRQRVENALGALLPLHIQEYGYDSHPSTEGPVAWLSDFPRDEIILLAAWDPRNGGIGCEGHHRRFDGHRDSPENPKIVVPGIAAPSHLLQFVVDYGLESAFVERFAGAEVMRSGTLVL